MHTKRSDMTALALSMSVPSVAAYVYFVMLGESPAARVVYAMSRVFLIAFPVAWFLLVERGRPTWPSWSSRGVLWGAGFALAVGATAWLAYDYVLAERLDVSGVKAKADALHIRDHYVLFAVFLSLANSCVEEYYWRWFVFGRCRRRMGAGLAAVCSGLAFGAHHGIVLTVMFGAAAGVGLSLAVAVGGMVWALLYERCKSLYAPWISHLLVDAAVMWIGYRMLMSSG